MSKILRCQHKADDRYNPYIFFLSCEHLEDFRDFEAWCDENINSPFSLSEPNYMFYHAGPLAGQPVNPYEPKLFTLFMREASDAMLVKLVWSS